MNPTQTLITYPSIICSNSALPHLLFRSLMAYSPCQYPVQTPTCQPATCPNPNARTWTAATACIPANDGGTYGERDKFGPPVALNMAIGENMDVEYEMVFPYRLEKSGSAVVPVTVFSSTSVFVDNDVTTLKLPRMTVPYNYVGSVTEAFYERLMVTLKN